jgi:hypothetical protein
MKLELKIIQDPGGRIRALIKSIGDAGKAELNAGASAELFALVRGHLRKYASTHHGSANRLGAMPTGHLEKAAATMQHGASAESAFVAIHSPGIRRALAPLTIRPVRARALTIPIHAIAYGRRVAEVARTHAIYRMGGTNVLAADIGGKPTPLYVLKSAVTIPRDRGILPSDAKMQKAVRDGYLDVIRAVINKLQMGAA